MSIPDLQAPGSHPGICSQSCTGCSEMAWVCSPMPSPLGPHRGEKTGTCGWSLERSGLKHRVEMLGAEGTGRDSTCPRASVPTSWKGLEEAALSFSPLELERLPGHHGDRTGTMWSCLGVGGLLYQPWRAVRGPLGSQGLASLAQMGLLGSNPTTWLPEGLRSSQRPWREAQEGTVSCRTLHPCLGLHL